MSDFEPDEATSLLFDACDTLMDALDAAMQAHDKKMYDEIKGLLVQTAALIDAKANAFKPRL
ncbi:MAG TPA: hypothetical protein VHC71_03680 [Hyphomicrobium sp.]|jgi:hypothetical protein|nr:hypothetical protein [Hyphomicrobium sp.]